MDDDAVDRILAGWASTRPDLDTTPIAVIGRIFRAARVLQERADATLASRGLTRAEFDLLSQLRRSGEALRPSALTAGVVGSAAATTKRLTRLSAAGLVLREVDPDDGRAARVHLTEGGRALVDELLPVLLQAEQPLVDVYTPEEREQLAALLRKGLRHWDT